MLARKKKLPKFANEKRPTLLAKQFIKKNLILSFTIKKKANQFRWPANFFGWLSFFGNKFFNVDEIYMYRTVDTDTVVRRPSPVGMILTPPHSSTWTFWSPEFKVGGE